VKYSFVNAVNALVYGSITLPGNELQYKQAGVYWLAPDGSARFKPWAQIVEITCAQDFGASIP
jgi:hypothetical protein